MGKEFGTAQQTLVWLGEEAEDSAKANEFIHWIQQQFSGGRKPTEEWLTKVGPRDGVYGSDWAALEKLFSRPWWTRVWTVQEYIVPDELIMYCGNKSFT
jgi:hypothetical protein